MDNALDELLFKLENSAFRYNHAGLLKDAKAEIQALYRQIELSSVELLF